MYILDTDEAGSNRVSVWDVESGERVTELAVVRPAPSGGEEQNNQHSRADFRACVYIQVVLDHAEQHLIAFHKGASNGCVSRSDPGAPRCLN